MDIQDKYKQFYQVVLKEAQEQRSQTIQETEQEFLLRSTEYENRLLQKSNAQIQHEKDILKSASTKIVMDSKKQAKKSLIDKRDELTENMFLEVAAQLKEFTQSEDYLKLLLDGCKEAKEALACESIIVYLSEQDMAKKDTIEQIAGVSVKQSETGFIGGFVASNPEGTMVLDKTFDKAAEYEKKEFMGFKI